MQVALVVIYSLLLAVVLVIDIKTRLVPDKLVYPGMLFVLVMSIMMGFGWAALAGGLVGAFLMLVFVALLNGNLGMGDVKLAALTGMMVGLPYSAVVIALSWIMGMLMLPMFKKGERAVPFAPAIGISAITVMIWQVVK